MKVLGERGCERAPRMKEEEKKRRSRAQARFIKFAFSFSFANLEMMKFIRH